MRQCRPNDRGAANSIVFREGVGRLEGEYHIRLDSQIDPVQHAPRRVPVALRDRLQEALEDLVHQDILAPVTEPTAWMEGYGYAWTPKTSTWLYNVNTTHYQPLKTSQPVYLGLRCSLSWTCDKDFGMFHWTRRLPSSPHLTHPLVVIGGSGCRLGLAQPPKFFNEECTKS